MEEKEISQNNMGTFVLVCTAAPLLRNTSLNQLYEIFAAGPLDTLSTKSMFNDVAVAQGLKAEITEERGGDS